MKIHTTKFLCLCAFVFLLTAYSTFLIVHSIFGIADLPLRPGLISRSYPLKIKPIKPNKDTNQQQFKNK
jgi:hypothetical protein